MDQLTAVLVSIPFGLICSSYFDVQHIMAIMIRTAVNKILFVAPPISYPDYCRRSLEEK